MDYIRACFDILYFFMRNNAAHKIFTLRMSTNKNFKLREAGLIFSSFGTIHSVPKS